MLLGLLPQVVDPVTYTPNVRNITVSIPSIGFGTERWVQRVRTISPHHNLPHKTRFLLAVATVTFVAVVAWRQGYYNDGITFAKIHPTEHVQRLLNSTIAK